MKKNTLLFVGIAAAAVLFLAMRRRPTSRVEAGSPIKITAEEFEAAEVVDQPPPRPMAPKSVVDVFKSLKRTPQAKAAAKARKALKKQPKAKAAVTKFLTMPRAVRGVNDISVLY